MFRLKNITIKNFLSIGNNTQVLNLNGGDLVLVLGENLDLGGEDSGSRNGVGKSSLMNAISYALYGWAVSNIKKEHLINKTNAKNMLVTLDFESKGISYRIVRGRKPNILEFYVNGQQFDGGDSEEDSSQGDSRETQAEIEKVIGMTFELFSQIVLVNTYTTPFLYLRSGEQTVIIEQLLGITVLSDKAVALKEEIKGVKDALTEEDIRIRSIKTSNERISKQIEQLITKQQSWDTERTDSIEKYKISIHKLEAIDIDQEIAAHERYAEVIAAKEKQDAMVRALHFESNALKKEKSSLLTLQTNLKQIEDMKCHACSQRLRGTQQASMIEDIKSKRTEIEESLRGHQATVSGIEDALAVLEIPEELPRYYSSISAAYDHRTKISLLHQQLTKRTEESNPYTEQIEQLANHGLEDISYDLMNELSKYQEHQEFLLKLLTNKDSFIRKKIIEVNLPVLNQRLSKYLNTLGLPHTVLFNNDLSVDIRELGRELSPGNLSRGEMTRLSIGLSFAFRDVWESLYQTINLLFIDESIDNGVDRMGAESAVKLLRDMNREQQRDIWLVSHKEELISKFNSICRVIKENGFTHFEMGS